MKTETSCGELCRFCEIFKKNYGMGKIDMPILKNDSYNAIVSAGAFVLGWVLIVPREHVYSMKDCYCDVEFMDIANKMIEKLSRIFSKKCIIFEHGANHEGSVTACGVNHAHMHILPFEYSLLDLMKKDNLKWEKCKLKNIKEIVGENEYWFYAEQVNKIEDAEGYVHIIANSESQYFRRLLAEKLDNIKEYNYKKYRDTEIEEKTYDLLVR